MLEFIQGYYAYIFLAMLFTIGLYGMMIKQNLMKKVLGMSVVAATTILFWIVAAYKEGAGVTVLDPRIGVGDTAMYLNPLPHTLMLTAIVVAVVTLGVALSLLITIYREYKTLDEPTLLERMK